VLDGTSLTLPEIMKLACDMQRERNMRHHVHTRVMLGYVGFRAAYELERRVRTMHVDFRYFRCAKSDTLRFGDLWLHLPNQFFAAADDVICLHWTQDPEIEYPGCHAIIAFPFPDEQRREYAMKIFNEYKTPVDTKLEKP